MRSAVPLGLATLGLQPLGLGMTRGGGVGPSLMILPPPAFASGRTVLWKQATPIRAYSDGTKWWNTNVSPWVEIEAWWAPARCKLHVDFENSRFYWNGTVRSISDLTAVTGGYVLTANLGISTAVTAQYEYRHNHATTVSGTVLSWFNSSPSRRHEFVAHNINTDRKLTRMFAPKSTTGSDFISFPYNSKTGEGGSLDGRGRQRVVARLTNGQPLQNRVGPGELHSTTFGDGANVLIGAVTKFGFSARASDNADPLTNSQLFFATLWAEALTDDETFEVQAPINVPLIHLIGDSFLNLYKAYDQVRLGLEANSDRYYAISQDGIGGTSLQQQASRFITEFTPWHKATLVIADGGRDYAPSDPGTVAGRNAFNEAAVDSMRATLTHNRWLLLGSAPNNNAGTGLRDDWDQTEAFLATYAWGNWVDTLTPMQARSNGGADDINYVTNLDLWPLSQRTSAGDFHPSAAGYVGYGLIAADALIAKGWDVVPNIGA